jgi:hypothetical protein
MRSEYKRVSVEDTVLYAGIREMDLGLDGALIQIFYLVPAEIPGSGKITR